MRIKVINQLIRWVENDAGKFFDMSIEPIETKPKLCSKTTQKLKKKCLREFWKTRKKIYSINLRFNQKKIMFKNKIISQFNKNGICYEEK